MKTLESLKSFAVDQSQMNAVQGGNDLWIGALGEMTHHAAMRAGAVGLAYGAGLLIGTGIYSAVGGTSWFINGADAFFDMF
jgi:hypothetical protein